MKTNNKIQMVLLCCLMFGAFKMNSQNAKWSRNGDNVANNDWLGTTNSEPLLLKANNNLGIKIKPNGEVILKPLDLGNTTFPNGLVMADGMGKVFRINLSNNATDFLKGDGTWGTLPASASAWNVVGNNLVSTNTGNVGIGNPNPFYKLDVTGDVRISNNLLVGGGIITSQTVNATGEVRGGDGIIYNDISVGANGNFGADVNVGNKLNIGPTNTDFQLSFTPASGPNPSILNFAKMSNLPSTPISSCNVNAYVPPMVNNFGGMLTLYNVTSQNQSNQYVQGTTVLDIGAEPGSSFISSRFTPLSINSVCQQDIYLMGTRVGVGTNAPSEKLHVKNGNAFFEGTAFVRTTNADALAVYDPTSNVANFKVKSTGFVYAREVIVSLNNFPDYVFANDYKLMPISEVKAFTQKNKHLPNMPTALEVETDGANLGEIQRVSVEKIEELYKYIFLLEDEVKALKARLDKVEGN